MTEETTSEQLAEIDRDMADIERQVAELVEEAQQADCPQPEPQSEPQPEQPQPEVIEELRSEVSYVQRLLGESRQRVTELEKLVVSLRTINKTQEKAFEAANKENTALRLQVQNRQQEYERQKSRIEFLETLNAGNGAAIGDYIAKVAKLQSLVDTARGQLETAATEHDSLSTQLAAVKAELVTQAETSRRLRIELDAAQQVPADSPELRQLRADLAEVIRDRDTYRHAHELLLNDVNATHQRTKVMTIEAIVEWLVPIRTCGSQALATAVISNLPHIMRSLTGLEDEGIE